MIFYNKKKTSFGYDRGEVLRDFQISAFLNFFHFFFDFFHEKVDFSKKNIFFNKKQVLGMPGERARAAPAKSRFF